jgi:hypothetical protein
MGRVIAFTALALAWDINKDGVAHYGLYPDWIEDLRMQAGNEIVGDMARGAEAYLEMWERAMGVPAPTARSPRAPLTGRGLGSVHLGDSYLEALQRAGQPMKRNGRVWTWKVAGERRAKVIAVLTPSGNVGMVAKVGGRTRIRGRPGPIVRGVRRGKPFAAAASRTAAKHLREYLRLAGLR